MTKAAIVLAEQDGEGRREDEDTTSGSEVTGNAGAQELQIVVDVLDDVEQKQEVEPLCTGFLEVRNAPDVRADRLPAAFAMSVLRIKSHDSGRRETPGKLPGHEPVAAANIENPDRRAFKGAAKDPDRRIQTRLLPGMPDTGKALTFAQVHEVSMLQYPPL